MIDQVYFDKIVQFFKGDTQKAWLWFKTPNPGLGNVSPINMILLGREKKLKMFIDSRLEGYWP
jgi:uncharacterized protein (DUF2384 family)